MPNEIETSNGSMNIEARSANQILETEARALRLSRATVTETGGTVEVPSDN